MGFKTLKGAGWRLTRTRAELSLCVGRWCRVMCGMLELGWSLPPCEGSLRWRQESGGGVCDRLD